MKVKLDIKPLSVNCLWRGRRFKTPEYEKYGKDIALLLPYKKIQMVEGYVNIHYKFYLKNWKGTDGDNLVKGLQDVLVQLGCIEDDRKIMKYVIEKIPSKENRIEVEIEEAK